MTILRRPAVRAATVILALTVMLASTTASAAALTFTFKGGGWGHGIGLSQYGAKGFAQQGRTHSWILNHFYAGTTVKTSTDYVTVKVNLDSTDSGRSRWWIQAGTTTTMTVKAVSGSSKVATIAPGASAWIIISSGLVSVCRDSDTGTSHVPGSVIATFPGEVEAMTGSSRSQSLIQILSASGPFNGPGIRWRGSIRFRPSGTTSLLAINYVYMEQYLLGVVPREMPSSWRFVSSTGTWVDSEGARWNIEALKAQAVAARSYSWSDAKNGTVLHCTTRSQVYNGHSCATDSHEMASTNAAVAQTKGQLVWYGSESAPVKTYFSSSSGGRTAAVQDVWVSGTPKPYYTSVTDADQTGPDYAWTRAVSQSTLSSRIRLYDGRSGGLDYSEPSPAVITAISVERASSGFSRYVTLRWSTGRSFRIPGTTLQSGFNYGTTSKSSQCLSSKYVITTGATVAPPAATGTRYEQTDSRFIWKGSWGIAKSTSLSGGSMRYTPSKDAAATFAFSGTGFSWVGNRSRSYGRANVYLDGRYAGTVDLYSATTRYKQKLFTKTGLTSGTHVVSIKALRTRNSASTGYTVAVDAADITGTLVTVPPTRFQQTDGRIGYLGTWNTGASTVLSGGSMTYTAEKNALACITFTGTGIRWIGNRAASYGKATVSLDGGAPVTVSLTSTSTAYQQAVWTKTGLPSGTHTVVIKAIGPETTATAGSIAIDAVDVYAGTLVSAAMPRQRLDDVSTALAWSGAWKTSTSTSLVGGSQHYASGGATGTMTVKFDGTGFSWIGNRAPSYGKANVYLDGRYAATIDLYAARSSYRQALFTRTALPLGPHTVVIRALGTKRTGATGTTVAVDAIDVWGTATK